MRSSLYFILILLPCLCFGQSAANLQELGNEFWQWRFVTQPASPDDILRVERPANWAPDFSPQAIKSYQATYHDFRDRLNSLPHTNHSPTNVYKISFMLYKPSLKQ